MTTDRFHFLEFFIFAIFGPFFQFWSVFHFGAFLHFWVVRGGYRGGQREIERCKIGDVMFTEEVKKGNADDSEESR